MTITNTVEKVLAVPVFGLAGATLFGYKIMDLVQFWGVFWGAMAAFAAFAYSAMMIYFRLRKEWRIRQERKAIREMWQVDSSLPVELDSEMKV